MRRRPLWRIFGGIAAALLVAIAGFFAWIQSVASRRWAELEARVPRMIAEARARDPRRPPRSGAPVPGNAWTDYDKAMKAARPLDPDVLNHFLSRMLNADRAKAEAVVAAHEGALAPLAAGARKAEGAFPYAYEKGIHADLPGFLSARNLTHLAAAKARLLTGAGKGKEAAELLLDLLWFCADQGRDSLPSGDANALFNMAIAFEELRALAVNPAIKDVDWTGLGGALEVLDAAWPDRGESMLNEGVRAAAELARPDSVSRRYYEEASGGALFEWRYGFSMRIMILDALETNLAALRRAAAASRSWPETERVAQEIEAETQASGNPVVKLMMRTFPRHQRTGFDRRAQLRLLRKAVALRAGLALELDDPFGGKLRSDPTKLWSAGPDGVDAGGLGAWLPAPTGDIVLELKPK